HLCFFCLGIFEVVRIGFAANWHLLYHLQAVTFESDNFFRIIGQKTELANAKIEENLRAETVVAQIAGITKLRVCLNSVESFLLQFIGMDFCCQSNAASFLSHVNQDTAAFLLNLPQRGVQLISTIAPPRAENVASETLAVHAHQRWFVLLDLSFFQGKMMLAVECRAIQMQVKIAVIGGHLYDQLQFHELFT